MYREIFIFIPEDELLFIFMTVSGAALQTNKAQGLPYVSQCTVCQIPIQDQ